MKPNDHPVKFPPERLRSALSSLKVLPPDLEFPIPLFSCEEIDILLEPIRKAMADSSPNEEVEVAITGSHQRSFGNVRAMTTMRIFMTNGELNLIFGTIHAQVDEINPRTNTEYTYYRPNPFKQGTRCKQSENKVKLMVSQPGVRFYMPGDGIQRSDWLVVSAGIQCERVKPDRALIARGAEKLRRICY